MTSPPADADSSAADSPVAPSQVPSELPALPPLTAVPPDLAPPGGSLPAPAPLDPGWTTRTRALEVLAALAVAYTLFFARAVLLPFTLAFVLALLFRPVVRHLRRRWHLNEYAGAAGVLAGTLGLLAFGLFLLAVPAEDFVRGIPEKVDAATVKLQDEKLFRSFQSIQRKLSNSGELSLPAEPPPPPPVGDEELDGEDPNYAALGAAGPAVAEEVREAGGVEAEVDEDVPALVVEERPPSLLNRVFNDAPEALGGFALAFVFLYFLLAEGDAILNNVIGLLPTIADKREAVGLTRAAEKGVSRYLMLVSAINAALGVCIGIAMWLVGLPNPVLWGVMAGLLNFIPYVGAFVGAAVVFLVAYLEPEFSLGEAALAPLCYMGINLLEGNFVTPAVLGKTIALNPLMVLLSLAFWGWIWGPTGAVLAVPLLSMTKIVCEDVEALRPLALLLGPRLDRESMAAANDTAKTDAVATDAATADAAGSNAAAVPAA
ncbi:AI-2E family transporter [Alienimonas sp. DA493]|uniref:AI-2E family transporter n=1 Tax=Alienimonas sp. DA493 TaxID=3373605 RepID=UPI003754F9E8